MDPRFRTTQWSLVTTVRDGADPDASEALADLCRIYWPPVYAYVRCRERDPETARELTQGFFAMLLEKDYVKDARRDRGKFRTFLLASVKNYLGKEWARARTQKRGGGESVLSLDFESEESRAPVEPDTPETLFERRWALALLLGAIRQLEGEMQQSGKEQLFRQLRPYLTGESADTPYEEVAESLGMTKSALKVSIHRLRRRLGRQLRDAVAQTLSDPALLDEEMRFLREALR